MARFDAILCGIGGESEELETPMRSVSGMRRSGQVSPPQDEEVHASLILKRHEELFSSYDSLKINTESVVRK